MMLGARWLPLLVLLTFTVIGSQQGACRTILQSPRSNAAAATRSAEPTEDNPEEVARRGPSLISRIVQQALGRGRSEQAARVIVSATTTGDTNANAEAAATAVVEQSKSNRNQLAEALVTASVQSVTSTSTVLARAAAQARRGGNVQSFASAQAEALAVARRRQNIEVYAKSVAQAISQGGEDAKESYAAAFASAAAAGGDQAAGLAQATAVVFCEGGASAEAYAEALARAVTREGRGCYILTETRAYAYARCGPEGAQAVAGSSAVKRVLGNCGLSQEPRGLFDPFNYRDFFNRFGNRNVEIDLPRGFSRRANAPGITIRASG